ncbi:hypothetical protein WA026_001371 [Henosepilachna vigintioctopunctata]
MRLVFEKIRDKRRLENITLEDMKKLGKFIQGVSSYNLWDHFDCSALDHLYLIGKANLKLRHIGIVADCLIKTFGPDVYNNHEYINRMTSIICGFGVENLRRIDMDQFLLVNAEVFSNLPRCSRHQLKALYDIAVGPNVYGPPYSWDKSVINTLGRLLIVASIDEVYQIEDSRFRGITPAVVRELDPKIIDLMNELNIHLELSTKREIWKMVGLSYRILFEEARSTLH